jgi:hypothetical protein
MYSYDYSSTLQSEKYLHTIKELRCRNFGRNLPFLMLSSKLPDGQVYREYPDGRIELQNVFTIGSKFEYNVIRILTPLEANEVRSEYGLL